MGIQLPVFLWLKRMLFGIWGIIFIKPYISIGFRAFPNNERESVVDFEDDNRVRYLILVPSLFVLLVALGCRVVVCI